jgi:hypothetical protein
VTHYEDTAAQTAEMLKLFPKLVRADREVLLRYARGRAAKYSNDDEDAERLFVVPIGTLIVASNVGGFEPFKFGGKR